MNDALMTLLVAVVWTAFAATALAQRDPFERKFLWASLVAHQVAAIAMVLVTKYYYGGGDMTNYFFAGSLIASHLRADFFDLAPALLNVMLQREEMLPFPGLMGASNTASIQALSGFLVYFFQDSLYAICMAIASASYAAKVVVFDIFKRELPDAPRGQLCFVCLLLPSTVFWSAGLVKEPIAIIGLSAMLSGAYQLASGGRILTGALRLALGVFVAGLFKGYLVPVFGVAAGMWFLARTFQRRFGQVVIRTRFVLAGLALVLATFLLTGMALPQFAPDVFAEEAKNSQAAGARFEGGSNYDLGSSSSVSAQLPLAIATVLFRPLIIEANNPLVFLNSLEMVWITGMVIVAFFRRPLVVAMRLVLTSPSLVFCFAFVATLCVGVGLTTTNLGTLSRYRMPLMPFYGVLLVVLASRTLPRSAPGAAAVSNAAFGSRHEAPV